MIISVWRYSHSALAVSSFLLLTLASLTGIILAFEPVTEQAKGYKAEGFDTITLAQCIPVLKDRLHGLQEIGVDEYDFVTAKFSGEDGSDKTAYIHPLTGEILGVPTGQRPLFEWATNLHRSLFLHETGRMIVGVVAFLLVMIALSGIALVIQRQKSIRRFFAPIEKAGFAQYYHTVFGRLSLIFILAIALTGTYLSASRFILKSQTPHATVTEDDIKDEPSIALNDFTVFQQTKLADVNTVQFPFSDFPEDYFTLKLKDREVCVNQFTGEILAQQLYSKSQTFTAFNLEWHTGRGHTVWAVIMAITSFYILFFIYSGLHIAWKRVRSKSKNKFKADECSIVILAGSENGSTYRFASAVYKQLIIQGQKVYLADLDTYTTYPKAKQLIIMTSTYGEGDPPSNAKHFLSRLKKYPQQQTVTYSVVGFGSRSYAHFCQFAYEADALMRKQTWATPLLNDVITVNDKSPQDFSVWLNAFTQQTGLAIPMPTELLTHHQNDLRAVTVMHKTGVDTDNTFLISMKAKRFSKIASGDLLAVYPNNDYRERLYSIGKVNGNIQLSVKLYEQGLGSTYLNALQNGDAIKVRIIKNQHFHFPGKAKQVIMISNGTGIAPFLGMITENNKKLPCYLFCGFRTQSSLALYESFLRENISNNKLTRYQPALSREGKREYVSHLLQKHEKIVTEVLQDEGVIMICGSLSMQRDVLAVLDSICRNNNLQSIEMCKNSGQVLTDCY